MSEARKAIDGNGTIIMLFLCLLWGVQQPIIKMFGSDVSPLLQIALRSLIGSVLLAIVMIRQNVSLALHKGPWQPGLLAGLLFSIEFFFVGESLRLTNASRMIVFLYTNPIYLALGLHMLLPQERLSRSQWFGITVSFAGIIVAFMQGFETTTPSMLLGDLFALAAGLFWGLTTLVLRCSRLNSIPPSQTTQYQLIPGVVFLLLACVLTDQMHFNPTPAAIAVVLGQGVIIAFFSLWVWFWLLTVYKASQLASFSFVSPIIGVAAGIILLNEPLHINFLIGAVLVITGVAIVNRPRKRQLV